MATDYRPGPIATQTRTVIATNFSSINDCLNHIVTAFKVYETWNIESGKYSVHGDLRGLARYHEEMGKRAGYDFLHITKKAVDHPFGIITIPMWDKVNQTALTASFNKNDLMVHLGKWKTMLISMNDLFTDSAYYLSEMHKITMYQKLCSYVSQIENEQWALDVLIARLTYDNNQHPDIKHVLKKLHVYFENNYDGKDINFDL
jgi:hypothetical protein